MAINKDWHAANPMAKNPTLHLRIEWHIEHAKKCGCRPIPAKLQPAIGRKQTRMARTLG